MNRAVLVCLVAVTLGGVVFGADKPRVFITDSKSWEVAGNHGGARPQSAEIIKTFGEKCPNVMINMKQEKADYVVVLEHEGGKGWARKDNKVAVFNWDGDSIASKSTRSVGGSVEEACKAITAHWAAHGSDRANALAAESGRETAAKTAPAPELAEAPKITVTSDPAGGDIEVDGNFVGNTPSAIDLTPGEHVIRITKSGYQAWERKMKVMSGSINVSAQLEPVKSQ
jgi:hypothetical protein